MITYRIPKRDIATIKATINDLLIKSFNEVNRVEYKFILVSETTGRETIFRGSFDEDHFRKSLMTYVNNLEKVMILKPLSDEDIIKFVELLDRKNLIDPDVFFCREREKYNKLLFELCYDLDFDKSKNFFFKSDKIWDFAEFKNFYHQYLI
jgi:hypothetical protein